MVRYCRTLCKDFGCLEYEVERLGRKGLAVRPEGLIFLSFDCEAELHFASGSVNFSSVFLKTTMPVCLSIKFVIAEVFISWVSRSYEIDKLRAAALGLEMLGIGDKLRRAVIILQMFSILWSPHQKSCGLFPSSSQ